MFVTEYCNDPNNIGILQTGTATYSDSISEEFDEKIRMMDRFLYLVDNYAIIRDCADDLKAIQPHNDERFWTVNKCLLNYVNAVFCYREFINNYDPPLTRIADQYYRFDFGKEWYRFVCELRNHVIHQSIIIRTYDPATGEIYIDLADLLEKQRKKTKDQGLENNKGAQHFLSMIQRLASNPDKGNQNKPLCSMKKIVALADVELSNMSGAIFLHAYKKSVRPIMKWLLTMVQRNDKTAYYTFIVNKEDREYVPIEPNYALEWYFKNMIQRLKKDSVVIHNMRHLFESFGYTYFYDGACDIEAFIQRWSE